MTNVHGVPYSVSYTDTMQQPLSPMVGGPMLDQQHTHHEDMTAHMGLNADDGIHG